MNKVSFLKGWGGGVVRAYKISLPFASAFHCHTKLEELGSMVGLLEIDILAQECWELLVSVGSGVQTGTTTPNNVETCSALCHDIDKLKEFERNTVTDANNDQGDHV